MLKISTSISHGMHINKINADESAKLLTQAGFDGVDLDLSRWQDTPERILQHEWREMILEEAAAVKAAGLEIAQCHLPAYGGHLPAYGDGTFETFESFLLPAVLRALEVCEEIHCPIAVLHPYFLLGNREETIRGNITWIRKTLPILHRSGIRLALENVYAYVNRQYLDAYVGLPETLLEIVKEVNDPSVGICIDTGHANILGVNIVDFAYASGSKLFALHINGNAGKDEHVIPCSMSGWCEKMNFTAFSSALRDIGFTGYYNLEIASGALPEGIALPFYQYAAAVAKGFAALV